MKIEYIIEVAVIFGEKRNSGTKLDAYICTVNKMFHLKPIVYGLYPYRIAKAKPGTQDQDKYIFVKTRSERFKVARTFQQSNYYSFIEDAVINNNPTIVKNPFQ